MSILQRAAEALRAELEERYPDQEAIGKRLDELEDERLRLLDLLTFNRREMAALTELSRQREKDGK